MGYSSNTNPKDLIKWLITTEGALVTLVAVVDTGAGAGDIMVFVTVSETYDLSTKASKMSLIGIHTPTKEIIQKTYPGLLMNSKFCRVVKQDVVLACASVMPFSADIVGTGADDVAPEDAFNPILYRAVSNDSMSQIEARLMGLAKQSDDGYSTAQEPVLHGAQAVVEDTNVTGLADEFNVYYSLLSHRDGFRTANPQQGLTMKGLVPLVFEKYYNVGENNFSTGDLVHTNFADADGNHKISNLVVQSMRGRAHPMPKFNTTMLTGINPVASGQPNTQGANWQNNGIGNGQPVNRQIEMPDLMPVYTALIIMPPKRLHTLFYRMVVRTTLEFTEVRPIQDITGFAELSNQYAPLVYHSDYATQSKLMTTIAGMVDAKDADIQKIMEGS